MRFALTFDDAPYLIEEGIPSRPELMDEIREGLQNSHIAHCVAFVVGERAVAHQDALRRWLEAGYELGNHTYYHERSSKVGSARTIESIKKCDDLLENIDAFKNGKKWFRFPCLDRGFNPKMRREIHSACLDLGYTMGPATVDFEDHLFEQPWQGAASASARQKILQRYSGARARNLQLAIVQTGLSQMPTAQVGYGHFSPLTNTALPEILHNLRTSGASFCSLQEAIQDPIYSAYNEDFNQNGIVSDPLLFKKPITRIRRKIHKLTSGLDLLL